MAWSISVLIRQQKTKNTPFNWSMPRRKRLKSKKSVPPAAAWSVRFPLRQVKANSVSGKFSKILYVETDLAGRRFIRLELKGTAQPLVEITPAVPFYAGKLQAGQVYEFRFELEPSQSGVVLSAAVDSGCRLEKSEGKWFAVCKLTPAGGTAIVEKEFRIDVVSPTGQPPLSIRIRGLLAD